MASPELQTVLTLTSGNSDQTKKSFRWGTAVPPIPVGTRAEWYVHAPGVLAVHLYVAFDGRMVHVAAAPGARVTVRGAAVGQEWSPVPVRTEVRFGDASFALTCEEVPADAGGARPTVAAQVGTGFTTAPPPSPGLVRTLIVREQKPAHAPPPVPKAARVVNAGPGGTRPMAIAASAVVASPAPAAAPAEPAIQPTAIMSTAAFAPTAVGAAVPMRPVALEPPAPGDAPPPPPAMGEKPSNHESSPTTMFDGGALRDHAYRIASMPPDEANAAVQEYAALVKQRAGRHPSDPPALEMSLRAQEKEARQESDVLTPPPEAAKVTSTVASGAKVVALRERLAKSWKETSNVKKAILFLLPFAAAGTLLERDPEPAEAPAPAKKTEMASATNPKQATEGTATPVSSAPTSATPTGHAAAASASASPPVQNAAATAPVASAAATAPVASAAPAAPVVSAESAPRAASSAAPSAAVVATMASAPAASASAATPSKLAANDPSADKRKPAPGEDDPNQRASMLEHLALSAVFGGNLSQAAMMYEKLAEVKPDAQVFALAARLVKQGAVRNP